MWRIRCHTAGRRSVCRARPSQLPPWGLASNDGIHAGHPLASWDLQEIVREGERPLWSRHDGGKDRRRIRDRVKRHLVCAAAQHRGRSIRLCAHASGTVAKVGKRRVADVQVLPGELGRPLGRKPCNGVCRALGLVELLARNAADLVDAGAADE